MKFKDIKPGEFFYNKNRDTLHVKTTEFRETDSDKFVWNSIVISSTIQGIGFHKGKGAWYSDDADIIKVEMEVSKNG